MSELIRLKNGADLPVELAASRMFIVRHIWRRDHSAAIELIALCRDPAHRPVGNTTATLQGLNLLQPDGTVHTAVRDLVLSAVQGEGEHMTLGSPYAGEEMPL